MLEISIFLIKNLSPFNKKTTSLFSIFFLLVGRLKPLDVEFMKALHGKVNIVPVIAKADTLTLKERERLKRRVGLALDHAYDATHTMLKANVK